VVETRAVVSYSLFSVPFLLIGVVGAVGAGAACVPTGTAPPYDAGPAPSAQIAFRASTNIMTAPFEDNFDRSPDAMAALGMDPAAELLVGDASSSKPLSLDAAVQKAADAGKAVALNAGEAGSETLLDGGLLLMNDAGNLVREGFLPDGGREPPRLPSNLGPNWLTTTRSNAWRVENGRLCGENAHNHGVWLNKTLPVNARIEFDAYALTENGDLKAEVWGDGHSYATAQSYTMATSYLAILGGWHNQIHALARLNEHGTDRKEIHVDKDSDDPRQRAVVRGQLYQFKIERTDGKTVKVAVNGIDYFSFVDAAPLIGQGHDHFGFNEWEAKVCFDNVKVTPL
jgi:hypothetical protein